MLWWLGLMLCAGGSLAPQPVGEPVQFTFPATAGRLYTGVYLRRGETVSIDAAGEWTMWDGHFGKSNALGHRYRVGLYGWGCLMARIGTGEELAIGTKKLFTAADSGVLLLYPNLGGAGLTAPAGELTVTVRGGRPVAEVIDTLAEQGAKVLLPADGGIVGVYVPAGKEVRIDAFGEWTMFDGGPPVTANGDLQRRLPDGTPWGRLQARFGGATFGVGDWQTVGTQRTLRAVRGGLLELRPAVGPYAGHPRAGTLTVVLRGGEPATDELKLRAEREAQDYERALGFLRYAQYRRALLLPVPTCSPALMKAAQAHAEYLAARDGRGHAEEPTALGYVGASPLDRALAMGWKPTVTADGRVGELLGEGLHGFTDAVRAVDGLWSTIAQRAVLAEPAANEVGVGVAGGQSPVFVLLVGGQAPAKLPEAALWPRDGQTGVAPSWSGLEDPAVLPDDLPKPVGPLLSVTLGGPLAQVVSADLRDDRGHAVALFAPQPRTVKVGTTLCLVPREPLAAQQTYHCKVVLQPTTGGPRTLEWRFVTGSGALPALTAPRFDDPANPPLSLERWTAPAPPASPALGPARP